MDINSIGIMTCIATAFAILLGVIWKQDKEMKTLLTSEGKRLAEVARVLVKLTPTPHIISETIVDTLRFSTIFPNKFLEEEEGWEKRQSFEVTSLQRRERLNAFFRKAHDHPLRPGKMNDFFNILYRLKDNPRSIEIRTELSDFLKENPLFIGEIKSATISPLQCEDEVLLAESWFARPLRRSDDIGNISDFFRRNPNHPLNPENLKRFTSTLNGLTRKKTAFPIEWQTLTKMLQKEWDTNGYYLSGDIILRSFLKVWKEIERASLPDPKHLKPPDD